MVDGDLVFRVGIAEKNDSTCSIGALCELISTMWIQRKRMHAQGMPSVKMRWAKIAARLAVGRKVLKDRTESGSFSSSAPEDSVVGGRTGQRRRAGGGVESRYGEVDSDGSTKAGCHKPETALSFFRRAESSSDCGGSCKTDARETHSSSNVPTAVIKSKSPTAWQEEGTAK